MSRAPIVGEGAARRLNDVLERWRTEWRGAALVGTIEHRPEPDEHGHYHWLVRARGDEKEVITLWLSLRQRSVRVECELMPAPETDLETLFRYLLVRNRDLREVHLAIGPEEGIYLVAQVPFDELTMERLDDVVGAVLTYVDEIYPTAMAIGLARLYRRRPVR